MSNTATHRPAEADWQKAMARAMETGAMSPRRARALGFTADMQAAWTTPPTDTATLRHTHVVGPHA